MRVLIAGCGYVGCELGRRLVAAGHRVWGLRRRPAGLPGGVAPVAADLVDPAALAHLPTGLDAVVYAASADAHDPTAYRAAYVTGPRHLIAALAAQGAAPFRLLFVSSTGVYGQSDGSWVDETSPTEPPGFAGQLLLEGEGQVLATALPTTVVRLGGIYGPGRWLFADSLRTGAAEWVEQPPEYVNLIHRDDCAGVLHHLLEIGQPEPLYLAVDSQPDERGELLRWLAERLGTAPPRRVATRAGVRHGGSKRCRNDRLLATGYRFRFPSYRDGFASLVTTGRD